MQAEPLCFSTAAAFGQDLQTLYCGKDSCYLMEFAAGHAGAASVGMFSAMVGTDTLARGDSLVREFFKLKLPIGRTGTSTILVKRGDSSLAVPRSPEISRGLAPLNRWMENRKREARFHRVWRDSLVLTRVSPDKKEMDLFLESSLGGKEILQSPVSLKVYHSISKSPKEEPEESQSEVPLDTVRGFLKGQHWKFILPMNAVTVEAILKVKSTRDSTKLPNPCMEGVFELRSELLELAKP